MMEKNILIINYYYPPIINGGIQRTYNFKKYLSQMGYNVSFLTTNSFGVLENDEQNKIIRFPDWGYNFCHSCKTPKIFVFLFRAFRLIQVKLGLITDGKYYWKKEVVKKIDVIMKENNFDIVIASYPTPVNLELGELIYKRYGIPLVVDYRDGLMFEPFYEIKRSFFIYKKRLLSLEKRMAKIASLQLTVNNEMKEYYSNTYPDVKSVMIPNGYDDEEIIDSEPLNLPKGRNILYTGAIGKSRKIYSEKELEKILSYLFSCSSKINFVFIGDYTNEERNIFSKYSNVYVFEKMDRKKVIATQRIADALLLISGPLGGTSTKLYEYLFSGKPILNIGEKKGIADIINGKQFGITSSPEEYDIIKKFLLELESKTLAFDKCDLTQYTRRYQSLVLAKELEKILQK